MTLTDLEREVIRDTGALWNKLCHVVGNGPTRAADLNELVIHIHAIQQAVMSQAAGRTYPREFRLLGEVIKGDK